MEVDPCSHGRKPRSPGRLVPAHTAAPGQLDASRPSPRPPAPHPPWLPRSYCLPFLVLRRSAATHLNHRVVELHPPLRVTPHHIHRGEGGGGGQRQPGQQRSCRGHRLARCNFSVRCRTACPCPSVLPQGSGAPQQLQPRLFSHLSGSTSSKRLPCAWGDVQSTSWVSCTSDSGYVVPHATALYAASGPQAQQGRGGGVRR